MKYIHVSNNRIDSTSTPVKAVCKRENVSFANGGETEVLLSMGWIPVIYNRPGYNPLTEVLSGPNNLGLGETVTDGATTVTAEYTVRAMTPSELTEVTKRQAREEIERLEDEITNRRIRDAIAGIDGGWMVAQEALLVIQRLKL